MRKSLVIFVFFIFLFSAFKSLDGKLFSIPKGFPEPVYDFSKNVMTKNKILLGRALFYDPILSRDNSISCSSCHSMYNAFAHTDHDLSHGIDDKIGTRNAPALMNLAWQKMFMWDGAVNHLEVQALAPLSHPKEMDESIANVILKLSKSPMYRKLFFDAYSDTSITGEKMLKALAQFQLTMVSASSRYDSVMNKQTIFTVQEESGYSLFRKNCNACHKEPLFSTYDFANNGLGLDTTLNDLGRMAITKDPKDSLKFKIPTLRNIEFSPPYMHDGRFKNLRSVLNHYTKGIQSGATLAPELKATIVLAENEKVDLVAFLLTLSDKKFTFSPDLNYPRELFLKYQTVIK